MKKALSHQQSALSLGLTKLTAYSLWLTADNSKLKYTEQNKISIN